MTVRITHTAHVFIDMEDDGETEVRGEHSSRRFRPLRVHATYEEEQGVWVLSRIRVTGPLIKVDHTLSDRMLVEHIYRRDWGSPIDAAPDSVLAAVTHYQPLAFAS